MSSRRRVERGCGGSDVNASHRGSGIKEFSSWPTIPQLYVNKEFLGGCDILVAMHQSGELAELLEKEGVLAPASEEEAAAAEEKK